jgi:integrase
MKAVSMKHTPHEARHTLATLLDRAEVNETTTRMILGHARQGVTKGVYTHKTLADLKKAIDRV